MATSSNREVELGIAVSTSGQDAIKSLRDAVANLAREGGDAAPEFARLGAEIDKIASQQTAIQSFAELRREVVGVTNELNKSAQEVDRLAVELPRAAQASDTFRTAQAEAKAELDSTTNLLKASRQELANLKASYTGAARQSDEYKITAAQLSETIRTLRGNQQSLREEYRQTSDATKEVVSAEKALNVAYNQSLNEARGLSAVLGDRNRALDLSREALRAAGVETTNLVEAERKVRTAFTEVRTAVEQQAAAFSELKAQEAAAAAAARDFAAEEDRLAAIVTANRQKMSDEARRQAAVEIAEYNRTAAAAKQNAAEKLAATQRAVAAEQALRKASADAAAALDNAFGAVGVRSIDAVRKEIEQVQASMATLQSLSRTSGQSLTGAFSSGQAKIQALQRELRELNGQLTIGERASKVFAGSLAQITAGNLLADGVGFLVNKVKEMGREFLIVVTQMETMRRGLTAVFGSSKVAAEQIEFLRKTAQGAGISFSEIADSFVRFSAATKSANIPLATTNQLFTAVTTAGATLGLSGERVTLVLDALGQMASKGVVSMEELRQQLGDSLPGALSLAAKGLKLTEAELIKLVESGQLSARDLFPGLTEGLKSLTGESDTLVSRWARLKNALSELASSFSDAGGLDILKGVVEALRVALGAVLVPLYSFIEGNLYLAKSIGILAAAAATGTNPIQALGEEYDKMNARIGKVSKAFDDSGASAKQNAVDLQVVSTAQQNTTSSAAALALAQNQSVIANKESSASALALAQANVRLLISSVEAAKAVEASIVSSEKLAKAKEIEGKAALEVAKLSGDANTIAETSVRVATENIKASEAVVAARRAEVAVTQELIDKVTASGVAMGGLDANQKKQIETYKLRLETQQASLEKAEQERNELTAQATVLRVTAEALQDNTVSLDAYGVASARSAENVKFMQQALVEANAEVERQKVLLEQGKGSQDALSAAQQIARASLDGLRGAQQNAAEDLRRYNDQLAIAAKNVELKAAAESASLQGTLALVNVARQHAESMANIARAQGNSSAAIYYEIEAKNRQIEAIRLTMQIKELEAKADIAALEIKKQEIQGTDAISEQKRKEIDIRIQLQKVKLLEAGASKDVIAGIEQEINAMRQGNSVRGSSTSSIEANTASRYKNVEAIKAQADAEKLTSDGFKTNKDGSAAGTFSNSVPLDQIFALQEKVRNQTLTLEDEQLARAALKQAQDARAYLDSLKSLNAGAVSLTADRETDGAVVSAKLAVERIESLKQGAAANERNAANSAAQGGAGQQPQGGSSSRTVNLVFNGRSTPVNVASEQDANNLESVLRSLSQAAGTST